MLLPKKVGSFTLMRKLDVDGAIESYVGILAEPAGKQVIARRIPPTLARDGAKMVQIRSRARDLMSVRHPTLIPVLDLVEADGDAWLLEDWISAIDLRTVLDFCARSGTAVPHNVYLSLATQICNGLEALHSRTATQSGEDHVLHLAISPEAALVCSDGRVLLGGYGLTRSPTTGGNLTGSLSGQVEYLSPEQTHQDQRLSPASDIFSLGTILYELLTLRPMFRAESNLQTIHRVRRAEVTTQLLEVKEILPGLDKVLFRALSLNPRHRYQRAFVLREDLRGLMAGFSFSDIESVARSFLAPVFNNAKASGDPVAGTTTPVQSTADMLSVNPTPGFTDQVEITERDTELNARRQGSLPHSSHGEEQETEVHREPRPSTGWVPKSALSEDPLSPPGRAPLQDIDTGRADLGALAEAEAEPETETYLLEESDTGITRPDRRADPLTGPLLETTSVPFSIDEHGNLPYREDTSDADSVTAPHALGDGTLPLVGHTDAFLQPPQTQPAADDPPTLIRQREAGWDPAADFQHNTEWGGKTTWEQRASVDPPRPLDPNSGPIIDHQFHDELETNEPSVELHTAEHTGENRSTDKHTGELTSELNIGLNTSDLQTAGHTGELHADFDPPAGDEPTVARPEAARSQPDETATHTAWLAHPQSPPVHEPIPEPPALQPDFGAPAASAYQSPGPEPEPLPSYIDPQDAYEARPQRPQPQPQVDLYDDDPDEGSMLAPIAILSALVSATVAGILCLGVGIGGLTIGGDQLQGLLSPEEPEGLVASGRVEPTVPQPSAAMAAPGGDDQVEPAPEAAEAVEVAAAKPVAPKPAKPRSRPIAPRPAPKEIFGAVASASPAPRPKPQPPAAAPVPRPPPVQPIAPKPRPAPQQPVARAPQPTQPVASPVPAPPPPAPAPPPVQPMGTSEMQDVSEAAFAGRLARADLERLAAIPTDDPEFTRARTLLYLDAKARNDRPARQGHLALLMTLPENRFNPALLVEEAQEAVEREDWVTAIDRARVAEQHWARLPSELIYSRKALIYEIQAVSHTGLFYESEGDNLDELAKAIRGWEKFQRHVRTRDRQDLLSRAEQNLDRLHEIQQRVE